MPSNGGRIIRDLSRRSTGLRKPGTRSPRPRCRRCSSTRGRVRCAATFTGRRELHVVAVNESAGFAWPRSCGAAACSGGWSFSAPSSSTSPRTSSLPTTSRSRCSPRHSCARATLCCSSASRPSRRSCPRSCAPIGSRPGDSPPLDGLSVDLPRRKLDAPGGPTQCRAPVGSQACPADRGSDRPACTPRSSRLRRPTSAGSCARRSRWRRRVGKGARGRRSRVIPCGRRSSAAMPMPPVGEGCCASAFSGSVTLPSRCSSAWSGAGGSGCSRSATTRGSRAARRDPS